MAVLVGRTAASVLSLSSAYRCPHFFIATASASNKAVKKVPFLKKRELSAVQTLSSRKPSQNIVPRARQRSEPSRMAEQQFDHLLVLDFEATCSDSGPMLPYPEIIEFPVAKLDVRTWTVSSYFHQYVRPTANPNLTSFCTHLTGIIQEMVDKQPTIDDVLRQFHDWLSKEGLLNSRAAFVTCGDWDLGVMLPSEAENKGLVVPEYFKKWINIKKSYCEHSGTFAKGLKDLLNIYKLEHSGRLHSGIDDVKTICTITSAIGKEGYIYRINGSTSDENIRRRVFKNVTVQ
ncbi:hypothetical protein Aduo_017004 [Ancylostoma duodenale]